MYGNKIPDENLIQELENLKEQGLTFYQCLEVFGTNSEHPYITEAQRRYCNNEIEIDGHAVLSESEDDGCWVSAWLWVSCEQMLGLECDEYDVDHVIGYCRFFDGGPAKKETCG